MWSIPGATFQHMDLPLCLAACMAHTPHTRTNSRSNSNAPLMAMKSKRKGKGRGGGSSQALKTEHTYNEGAQTGEVHLTPPPLPLQQDAFSRPVDIWLLVVMFSPPARRQDAPHRNKGEMCLLAHFRFFFHKST